MRIRPLFPLHAALLALVVIAGSRGAVAAESVAIRACIEDNESYPWLMRDQVGITTYQMQLVEKHLGSQIELTPLPWKRCIAEVKIGVRDAAIKISHNPQRAQEVGVFPTVNGKLDLSKRLHNDSYSLYRIKGSHVSWDGKTLVAEGMIGAQTGFSIIEQLKGLGANIDDGGRSANEHLRKMLLGRLVAVALQTQQGDVALARNPAYKEKIEKVSPLLAEKPYFLMFSYKFYQQHPAYSQTVWKTIETVRESPEYQKFAQGIN